MIIKYKDINDGNAVKEYNGSLLRLTGADGGVVLMSASALALTGTNGTVTAGQTLDLSTLLTVPSVLAGKTVSWSKASGSAALTLSGHTVTAESGATASDSATFTATVAGISVTVTVTAAAAAPTAYTLSVSATHATVTVTRDGTNITAGTAIYAGDVLTISAAAENGYQNPTITVNGATFTSGGTHTVSGDVTISATAEAVPDVQTVTKSYCKIYAYGSNVAVAPGISEEANGSHTSCLGDGNTSITTITKQLMFAEPIDTKPNHLYVLRRKNSGLNATSGSAVLDCVYHLSGGIWSGKARPSTSTTSWYNSGEDGTVALSVADSGVVWEMSGSKYAGIDTFKINDATQKYVGKELGSQSGDGAYYIVVASVEAIPYNDEYWNQFAV